MGKTLYCFIGESGSGKNAIVEKIKQEYNIPEVISYTARPRRFPEENGYIFSDEKTYEEHKRNGLVFEETQITNKDDGVSYHYWTLASEYEFDGKKLMICDTEGIYHLKDKLKDTEIVSIHIKADYITRYHRLVASSKKESEEEKEEEAYIRMNRSKEKFKMIPCDWAVDNNGSIKETFEFVKQIMNLK